MHGLDVGSAVCMRWYILAIFCLLAILQSATWLTFSAVSDEAQQYYHLSNGTDTSSGHVNSVIDSLTNIGPVGNLAAVPVAGYLLLTPYTGLQFTIKLSATLIFLGNIIRIIPTILHTINNHYQIDGNSLKTSVYLYIGQTFTAISGAFILSSVSKLSVIWFASNQRSIATGLGVASSTLGNCIILLGAPLLNNFELLLYIIFVTSSIVFLSTIIYFPIAPPVLPSVASINALLGAKSKEKERIKEKKDSKTDINHDLLAGTPNSLQIDIESQEKNDANEFENSYNYDTQLSFWNHVKELFAQMWQLMCDKSTMLFIIAGGIDNGIFSGLGATLQDLLKPTLLSDNMIGIIGFNCMLFATIGSVVVGIVADRYFVKKLKTLLYIILSLLVVSIFASLFLLPSPWMSNLLIINNCSHTTKIILLNIIGIAIGFFQGSGVPLYYELAAESSYPINQSNSAAMILVVSNFAAYIFIGIGTWLDTKWDLFLVLIMSIICIVLVGFATEIYKRR